MSEKSKKQKVSIVEKMGLFMVCAGNIPLMGLLSGFFMIYYTNVVGLEPAALATLFLISKVVDGISDPIMGYFLDKFPVTKMGKFRPMIILGTIICVINYILLWFGAVWIPVGKYVIVYVTYLLLGWTFDIMDIVAEGTLQNYYVLIFGSMAMVLVLSIAGALCVKERVAFEGKKEESYTFRELLQFLRYKPVWALFLVALVVGVGSNIAGGAGAYFYTYILGDMTLMSGVSLVSMITALVGIFLGPILANRFGKKQIFVMAIVVSILFSALRLIDVRSMLLIYISTVAGGVAGGCIAPLTTSIQADNTTYVQYKTGKRAEAAIASLTSFITKVAQGLGGAIPGYVLAATGFVTGSVAQPESINTGIILCVLILPTILTAAGAILLVHSIRWIKKQ